MKMNKYILRLLFGLVTVTTLVAGSMTGYIRTTDQSRYLNILNDALTSDDVANIHYAAQGFALLGKAIPSEKNTLACKTLSVVLGKGVPNAEVAYHISSAAKYLKSCSINFQSKDLEVLTKTAVSDNSLVSDIHYAVETLANLKKPISNAAKIAQIIQSKLKADDTLVNIGHAFHAASHLGEAGKFALDRLEEALVQADEVDGKLLQYEGGLSVTSLLLVGIDKVSKAQNKPSLIKQQAEKFSNYLVSRRSVQTVKGITNLLEAARIFTDNADLSPASISLASSGVITASVSIKICDLLGQPLKLPADSVVAQSATRLGDDVVVLAKQKLTSTKEPTIYNLELPRDRMPAGLYRVAISAGSHTASLTVSALASGTISSCEIGVGDADQPSAARLKPIAYPGKLSTTLEADSQQIFVVKFSYVDTNTKKPLKIQQAFVRFSCTKTKQEIVFVAEFDGVSNKYALLLDIGSKAALFGGQSGTYDLSVVVGDTIVSNPIVWELGQVELKLTGPTTDEPRFPPRALKPEIRHKFREADIRPPQAVSLFFTSLVLAPILLLFILWGKLGINASNFPFSLSAIVFHLGLASIYGLFAIFWLQLNMFQTSRWLLLLGVITFLSGHRLLRSIAEKRKH